MSHDAGQPQTKLVRGLGLPQAVALNVANMVGIGPFITIPLFIAAMGGPQAMIAWVIAAVLVICDGLVWSELGAALPGSGGTYHFLKEIFDRTGRGWGRLLPFLFIWQFLISGTLEMASGYIGAVQYLGYIFPGLESWILGAESWITDPLSRMTGREIKGCGLSWVAALGCLLITLLLCRRIGTVGWLGVTLCAGTLITVSIIVVAGLLNFDASLLTLPPNAFDVQKPEFATGLGAAMLIAIYDYFGYYNICYLGDEVRNPGKTIPRAVICSVVLVAAIYLIMNISIIGVVPWQQAMVSKNIAAEFMETLFGRTTAIAFTWLILWTAVASLFAGTLGYSRIPFAAAQNGDFFRIFTKVHPTRHYPYVSLLVFGGLTAVFCFFPLKVVIDTAVTVRILIQFISQIVALHVMRMTRPDVAMPFRMMLYPIPSIIALIGWTFVLATSTAQAHQVLTWVVISGVVVFFFFLWKGDRKRTDRD